jgi:hypothetical protein
VTRFVVTVARMDLAADDPLTTTCEIVVLGPFRSRERAEQRATVIRRLAETYEDPEGVTGPDNALTVLVEPLIDGAASAEQVLDRMYQVTA